MKQTKRIIAGIAAIMCLGIPVQAVSAIDMPVTDEVAADGEAVTDVTVEEEVADKEECPECPDFECPDEDFDDVEEEVADEEETPECPDSECIVDDEEKPECPDADETYKDCKECFHYNCIEDFDEEDVEFTTDFFDMDGEEVEFTISDKEEFKKLKGFAGVENAGKFVNIYFVDAETGEEEFAGSGEVNADGEFFAEVEDTTDCVVKVEETDAIEDVEVVAGDLTSDGKCGAADFVRMKSHIVNENWIDSVTKKSADVVTDGEINVKDAIKFKNVLIGNEAF